MSGAAAIGVVGLGEAGSAIAADLVATGATVRGWDPVASVPDGVKVAAGAPDAAAGTEVVLSANSAAPALKREIAERIAGTGALFADVALIAPVPGHGLSTPALVSGSGAARFAAVLAPLGMPVTEVGAEPGAAAARKLARSVFAKGLAAAIGEALAAAERLGFEDWLYEDLARSLENADPALLQRLIEGSRLHAARRVEEMAAAVAMLEEAGVKPRIAAASGAWLRSRAESEVASQ